ncbi:MAG: M48 family metallopeptidase [Myxococcales bacterium]|nr:M48 family metallopeptidase [Myxococcales bacterium]
MASSATNHRPLSVAGTWFSGESTAGVEVVLRWDGQGSITLDGVPGGRQFDVATMVISAPIGATPRSIHFGGRGKLRSTDFAAVVALERATGRGQGGHWLDRMEASWTLAALFVVLLVVGSAAGFKWGVPWVANEAAMALPASAVEQIGQGTLVLLDETMLKPSKLKPARQSELRQTFAQLKRRYDHLPLKLLFRRGIGPNAFALPDGTVLLTDELAALSTDDRQLIAVLAHEIGHVHHRHGVRMAIEGTAVSIAVAVFLGDVSDLGVVTAGMPAAVVQAQFSQGHETEADTFALETLMHIGVAPHHFLDIMNKLQAKAGTEDKGVQRYFASHPATSERVRRFGKTAPHTHLHPDSM